jgi:hypothetical protein
MLRNTGDYQGQLCREQCDFFYNHATFLSKGVVYCYVLHNGRLIGKTRGVHPYNPAPLVEG